MQVALGLAFARAAGPVRLPGMSDAQTSPADGSGAAAEHPVDAVLAAIRAVPDSVLRSLEPSTLFLPGGTAFDGAGAAVPADGGAR